MEITGSINKNWIVPVMGDKDPLKEWRKTTLWLRVFDGPKVEVNVWHPQDILDKERVALLAKHASQTVNIIRQLTGTKEAIVQGQYKDDPTTTTKEGTGEETEVKAD